MNVVTYKSAGVDIDAGNELVHRIKKKAQATHIPGVLSDIGHFGAMFAIPKGYHEPILVSSTDGVGTKLKLALQANKFDDIGIDLVAMCVNDVIVTGAKPLFFLDYYATEKIDIDQAEAIVGGISRGCIEAGCALVGGESAEMPSIYNNGLFDLAGFAVGIVEKSRIITAEKVEMGDQLIAIASSGVHSNGYSLINKLLEDNDLCLKDKSQGVRLECLMTPTKIYVQSLLNLYKNIPVHALAHITGGGLTENLPRVLPPGTYARINLHSWALPPIFQWIQGLSNLPVEEILQVFNCGIGMVACVPKQYLEQAMESLEASGETVWHLGSIEKNSNQQQPPETAYQGKWL